MSISLVGHGLSVVLPGGAVLLSNIDCSFGPGRTGLVGRNGVGKTTLLHVLSGDRPASSGRVVTSGRVLRLDQLAFLRDHPSVAAALGREPELHAHARASAGAATADDLILLNGCWDLPDRAAAALERVGLAGLDPFHPYGTLSGGEQTRIQLARVLLDTPDFVLLDEPTNNLDREARSFVYDWIRQWSGGLVAVSHDRTLLELMDRIAHLDERGLHLYGGNYTFFEEQVAVERAAAQAALDEAAKTRRVVQAQAARAREQQDRRQASGERKARRTGVSPMAAGIMKRHAEATAGRLKDRHADRVAEAERAVLDARAAVLPDRNIHLDLSSSAVPSHRRMIELQGVNVLYNEGEPPLWPRPLDVSVTGPERIAVVGRNGSGKSTLLRLVAGSLAPSEGTLRLGARRPALLDQRVNLLDSRRTVLDNARRSAPERPEHELRLLLARLLFSTDDVRKPAGVLSGGERMRAGLACLLGRDQSPDLLLLDEPTNNLDLAAVDEVAAVLRAFGGALLVVSHDETFLRQIGVERRLDLDAVPCVR